MHQCYNIVVIRNLDAYRRLCEDEYWAALAKMSMAESIALGEALLTSTLMDGAVFSDDDHPMSLARALGIDGTETAQRS